MSEDCEMYVQESGRAGRDGLQSYVIAYYEKGDLNRKYVSSQMMKYCGNEEDLCRRAVLFEDFDQKPKDLCLCCDLCRLKCGFGNYNESNLATFVSSHPQMSSQPQREVKSKHIIKK